ncbi:MAG: ABC transporter ATP-binding protein [Actinomycetia bacterium]|nr:ABC transporter ATP-binding protein [Actinomycetes bacterium]
MGTIMELQGLTKFYGKQRGIEDVSFKVEEGEIFGFIGPNGAGKSTTIRTLLALLQPTAGSATIFGLDCIQAAAEIARDVGYVPSESAYYDNMKVRALLDYTGRLYRKDCRPKAEQLCERLELDPTRKIADLSFGNKKKVGIVSALLHSPRLIILDEPTAGLDPLVQRSFFEILREENHNGATIFFSSHILSEVQKFCGRVAILKQGHLESVQTIATLRESGYKRIFVTAKTDIPTGYFHQGQIVDLQQRGAEASFMFQGDINALIQQLASLGINDTFIEEPTLEEIFLHYYE